MDLTYSPGDRSPEALAERRELLGQEAARRHWSGQMAADTQAMKGLANADCAAAYADELRPDPTAFLDLVDPLAPADAEVNQRSGGLVATYIVLDETYTHDDEVYRLVAEQVAAAAGVRFETAMDAVRHLANVTVADMEDLRGGRALVSHRLHVGGRVRRRHGSSAVCPRHGETRGGTCMKCARAR